MDRGVHSIEPLKNARLVFARHSRALIGYFNHDAVPVITRRQCDYTIGRRMPDGVVQKIRNRVSQQSVISGKFQLSRTFQLQTNIFLLSEHGHAIPQNS